MLLRRRHPEAGWQRSLAEILVACAVFSGLFGLCFGELFGDLGRRWVRLCTPSGSTARSQWGPFLILAVSLGGACCSAW
ncbi:MAG: hypothetical protein IPL76_00165 [Gemmatimonadetes bacterium]|nr:hypothetical protein [Gemmatimonadota bacterium]